MIYQANDTHWERPLTPDLSKAFKEFCKDVKNISLLENYIKVSERGINREDCIEVKGVGISFPTTSVQKVVEATFLLGEPCLRYIAYYTDTEKETGLFVLHYRDNFYDLCAEYGVAVLGEENFDAMLNVEGIPIIDDLMKLNFSGICGTGGKDSSLLKLVTGSVTGPRN